MTVTPVRQSELNRLQMTSVYYYKLLKLAKKLYRHLSRCPV